MDLNSCTNCAEKPAWQQIPVIVVTAKDITDDDRRRLHGHVNEILQKGSYTTEETPARNPPLDGNDPPRGRQPPMISNQSQTTSRKRDYYGKNLVSGR